MYEKIGDLTMYETKYEALKKTALFWYITGNRLSTFSNFPYLDSVSLNRYSGPINIPFIFLYSVSLLFVEIGRGLLQL